VEIVENIRDIKKITRCMSKTTDPKKYISFLGILWNQKEGIRFAVWNYTPSL
jgi:hypothetical protein